MDIFQQWLEGLPYAIPFLIILLGFYLVNRNTRDKEN